MSNKLIIKNDLIEVQTLPDNKLIFLIGDDNEGRYYLSNFKEQVKEQISYRIYDIKEEKRRKNRIKNKLKNDFLARILARLSTLQRKLRYINELSFFNRWIEKFKTEQINDFHFNFKNKYINEKRYRKSDKYIQGLAEIETKSYSFEELIKEMEKHKIPYHKYFIINELWNNLKINELKDYIDLFNSKYGYIGNLQNNVSKIRTLTISSKLSSLIKNFMEIHKIESTFLSDYVKFLEWLFSDIDFSDKRDYNEKLTDYAHFVWDLMSNAKKI